MVKASENPDWENGFENTEIDCLTLFCPSYKSHKAFCALTQRKTMKTVGENRIPNKVFCKQRVWGEKRGRGALVGGGLWWFAMVYGGLWWFVVVCGGWWWFVMVYGGLCWFVEGTVLQGSFAVPAPMVQAGGVQTLTWDLDLPHPQGFPGLSCISPGLLPLHSSPAADFILQSGERL